MSGIVERLRARKATWMDAIVVMEEAAVEIERLRAMMQETASEAGRLRAILERIAGGDGYYPEIARAALWSHAAKKERP